MQEPDKLTQTRSSLEMNNSFIRKIYSFMCPCFSTYKDKKSPENRNNIDYFASDLSNRSSTKQYEMPRKNTLDFSPHLSYKVHDAFIDFSDNSGFPNQPPTKTGNHKSRSFIHEINYSPKKQRENVRETIDLREMSKKIIHSQKKEWYNFPVFKYREGELVLLGKNNKNMLAEISSVKLQPSPTAVQKQFMSKQNTTKSNEWKRLDDFWNSRYFYFQKFDEGIQIDKQSLDNLIPQAVSDYIAGKCYDCKTVLDAFSGVGHNATKLGSICEKVICVEQQAQKYNFLINNAKCYEIYNLQLFMQPFLDINLKQKVDAALLHPQIIHENYRLSSMCETKHFKPNLSLIIKKALQVGNNLVILLPPNISIKDICYEISKSSEEIQQKISCSCSVKIQKIYFRNVLSYVAVFFGSNVQQQIKINSELGFIYKVLKDPLEKGFGYKKLIKYLREKYGIIRLLNIVSQSISTSRPEMKEIQKLIQLIRSRKLILQHKLQSLLVEQKSPRKGFNRQNSNDDGNSQFSSSPDIRKIEPSYTFEEQKERIEQQEREEEEGQTISERTQSFYSNASGFSAFRKRVTMAITESGKRTQNDKNNHSDVKIERQSNTSSIVIKKIINDQSSFDNQSKSPPSPTQALYSRIGNFGQIRDEKNQKNEISYRHTLNPKNAESELFRSAKQNLKRTLIQQ